jgi:hypothetical protein
LKRGLDRGIGLVLDTGVEIGVVPRQGNHPTTLKHTYDTIVIDERVGFITQSLQHVEHLAPTLPR